MRDKACIKTLSFKASLNDSNYITKTQAITNSPTWTFEEPQSGDDNDPPEADLGFFGVIDKGSSSTTTIDEPATIEKPHSKKRKAV